MIRLTAVGALVLLLAPAALAQPQLFPDLEGEPLLAALRADYTPTASLGYNRARDSLFAWEQRETGALRAVYSGYTITLTPGLDPTEDAYAQGINTEHSWPRSRGTGSEPANSDMHHLFPARVAVNSSRSNHPYGEVPDAQTDTWYRLDQAQSNAPSFAPDEWAEKENDHPLPAFEGRFEPRHDRKGDVARAAFYVRTVYAGGLDEAFSAAQLPDLLGWHEADPVSPHEAARNAYVAALQGTPNPFVLDPTLARRAFDADGGPPPPTPVGDLLVSEYVEGSGYNKAVELYNGTGAPVDLGPYELRFFFNGSSSAGTTVPLAGTLADGAVFVVADGRAGPAVLAAADLTSTASFFNGDDAVALYHAGVLVDAVGEIGLDPGSEWGSGLASTKDNTLRRRAEACAPDADAGDAFDPAALYEGHPTDAFSDLGRTDLDCAPAGLVAEVEPAGSTPVVIAAGGGPLPYTVTVSNGTAEPRTVEAWVVATLPSGAEYGPIWGPTALSLDAGETVGPLALTAAVPAQAPAGTYTVTLRVGAYPDGSEASDAFTFEKAASAALRAADVGRPTVEVFPNPVRDVATVQLSLPEPGPARLSLLDVLGREILVVLDGPVGAGTHEVPLDASALPPGLYVWRLVTSDQTQSGRLTVLR